MCAVVDVVALMRCHVDLFLWGRAAWCAVKWPTIALVKDAGSLLHITDVWPLNVIDLAHVSEVAHVHKVLQFVA